MIATTITIPTVILILPILALVMLAWWWFWENTVERWFTPWLNQRLVDKGCRNLEESLRAEDIDEETIQEALVQFRAEFREKWGTS